VLSIDLHLEPIYLQSHCLPLMALHAFLLSFSRWRIISGEGNSGKLTAVDAETTP
jgi:hypothetical protein